MIEVFEVFPELKEMIANGSAPSHLESAARAKGYKTMLDDALDRVRDDQTTLQEVMRVLGKREGDILAQSSTTTNRVLIVDDDPVIRVQTRGLLEKSGYSVSEADDGAEALETLKRDPGFSLVVTDLNMPEVGGREVLSTLRKNACTSGLPVIVLTGSSNVGGEAELIEEGADDYIRKPIDPASFIARIRATMRRAA